MFFTSYFLRSLRLLSSKLKDKRNKQKTSPKTFKTEIQILANPGFKKNE